MKMTLLTLAALFVALSARAENSSDFKWDAEFRLRYNNLQNAVFLKGEAGASLNEFIQRTKLGVSVSRGENFSGRIGLVNNSLWGDSNNQTSVNAPGNFNGSATGTSGTAHTKGNSLSVYEAWGWWKSSDSMSLKFGRASFEFGDATIIGLSNWGNVPNSWEGVWTDWNFEAAHVVVFGMKTRESGNTAGTTTAIVGNDDPEQNNWGLVAMFKNLPESIKYGGVHLIQTNDDDTSKLTALKTNSGAALTGSGSILRYGLTVKGGSNAVDYRATADMYTGKVKSASDITVTGSMYDVEGGYSIPDAMNARIYVNYHMDSGAKDATATDKMDLYMPLKPTMHEYAGLMDVVNWGNSTYIDVGFSVKSPDETMTSGIKYIMFSRTTDKGAASMNLGGAVTAVGAGSDKTAIGNEVDIWTEKKYADNFSIMGLYGMFMPGDLIKASTPTRPDTLSLLQVQGKLTF